MTIDKIQKAQALIVKIKDEINPEDTTTGLLVNELIDSLKGLDEMIQSLHQGYDEMEEDHATLSDKTYQLECDNSDLERDIRTNEREIEELKNDMYDLEKENKNQANEIKDLERQIEDLEYNVRNLERDLQRAESRRDYE